VLSTDGPRLRQLTLEFADARLRVVVFRRQIVSPTPPVCVKISGHRSHRPRPKRGNLILTA
jgi:hypothetical protein